MPPSQGGRGGRCRSIWGRGQCLQLHLPVCLAWGLQVLVVGLGWQVTSETQGCLPATLFPIVALVEEMQRTLLGRSVQRKQRMAFLSPCWLVLQVLLATV